MSQDLIELVESMVICWGLGLLVIVMRISKFFSNSGWWWAFECMEENLRIRMDGVLWSSETLVVQLILLGRGRASSLSPSIVRLE